jgi:hypothetical protein
MTTPINTQPNPFDNPNSAIRAFNDYFRSLRNEYGEDAIRAMGFGKADLAKLQGPLTKMLSDPSVTTEQRRQAFMQARDALAQKLTTPLASMRSYAQVQGLSSQPKAIASDGSIVDVVPSNLPRATPTQEQLYEYARGVAKGQQNQWDPRIGKFVPVPTEATASPFAVTPEVEVRGVRPPDVVNAPMPEMAVRGVMPSMPDTRALEAEKAAAEKAAAADKAAAEEAARIPMRKYVDPKPPVPGGSIPTVILTAEGYKPNPAYTADLAMQRYRAELANNNYYSPQERQQIMSSIENAYAQPGATGEQVNNAYQNASAAATRARPQVGPAAPVPSASDYISGLNGSGSNAIVASPHTAPMFGSAPTVDPGFNMPSGGISQKMIDLYTPPQPMGGTGRAPDGSSLLGPNFRNSMSALMGGSGAPTQPDVMPPIALPMPMTPPMQPAAPSMNTQPGADFDRNVARQIFDAEFRTLREKYGDEGLRAAGFTPRTLSALQAPLTNVQKDNTISYDQSSAALENALQQLRGYNFGGAQPAAPMQPAAPAPLPAGAQQSPMPGYYRGGPAMRYR